MTESDPDGPSGRHGGGDTGGLTVAELLARARLADGEAGSRPSRRSRRADEPSTLALAEVPLAEPAATELPQPATVRHLTVVEAETGPPADAAEIAAPPPPRAGRNLPAAIGVGVALGALVLLSLFLYRPSFGYVIVVAVGIAIYEIVTAIATVEARAPLIPLWAGAIAMQAAAWFRGPDGLVGAFLLTALGLIIWRLADGVAGYRRDVGAAAFVALYVPFLAGFATLSVHFGDGAARIVIFILVVVCNDTGGYIAGVLLGKHPMAPTVSPKKSWEGMAGSLIGGAIAGTLMMTLCFHHAWWQGTVFGVVLVVTATLGDLGESMIKRDLGIKDMGRLLPGHGGIMDRLDSLLPCAPVAYLLLAAFLR
ncbi:MAG TPA: phosphatidate cytidylyltransferase [Jatrophihabitans sp.]|nr:phosphatidate cytidylyltransferase [Jatrophihabitans sp.]